MAAIEQNVESRLETLELKTMDLELTVEQLNAVVIEQQATIDSLTRKLEHLQTLIQSGTSGIVDQAIEPPPPHY